MDNSILDNMRIDTFQDLRNRKRNDRKVYVPLNELHTFKNHPFKIIDDERMMELAENIKRNGVYVPGTVRPLDTGGYEIISGHRRKRACELAGLEKMPVYIKELDDDVAIIEMIDSNIQRDEILPSEKAFAFKMKLEAITHQGKLVVSENKDDIDENENRGNEESEDSTSRQVVGKLEDDCFENASQVGTHFYQCCTNGNEATRLSTCDHDGHKFRGGSPIEIVPMMGTIIVSNFCSS